MENATEENPTQQSGAPTPTGQESAVIVAAVDTSPGGGRIVEIAARLARRNYENAVLHIVHVFKKSWLDQHTIDGLAVDQMMDEARRYLDSYVRTARRQCSAEVHAHFAVGDPVDEIVRLADGVNADLLLIGAQDSVGAIERLLLGTVTTNVMQRAHCSVMVVRSKERAPRRE
ncbi:MAG: universal stress protein [Myxococcales bacterium]